MNGVGPGESTDFASGVEDVFLAGFDAWGDLGQMQSPLLSGSGNGNGGAAGGRAPPGIGSMTGLGGSMQSFLGEAGMYPDSAGSGADSFKDGCFSGAQSNHSGSSSSKNFGNGDGVGDVGGVGRVGGADGGGGGSSSVRDLEQQTCKLEPTEKNQLDDDEDCGPDSDEEHDYHQNEDSDARPDTDALGDGDIDGDGDESGQHQGNVRGLGRIFGVGTHPVVAEAQARAEALVHGRGGKGSSASVAEAAEKKRKRAVLSKEERAKQNRDRNREHARNTRLRKKAFVEELKKQVEELVSARDREEQERRAEARRDATLRDMRLQVLLTFLEYRGRAEMGRNEWQSVLDDHFEMRMPLTPYRSFPPHQVQGGMRVIKGVDGVMADTASLNMATKTASTPGRLGRVDSKAAAAAAASSSSSSSYDGKGKNSSKASSDSNSRSNRNLSSATRTSSSSRGATSSESCSGGEGDRSGYTSTGSRGRGASVGGTVAASNAGLVPSPLRVYYVVDPKEVMVNKNAFMCPFLARSPQLLVPGMIRCTFSTKSNRLSSLHFSFDPTVPARQLARAAMLQGRATPGMTGMMAGMLGMGGVDVTSVMSGGGTPPAAAGTVPGTVSTEESGSHASSAESGAVAAPKQASTGQHEGVLHSVLEDIREWRVSSTIVHDPKQGKSYLRVYPLNGDTPGVTHFIGVLENLAKVQQAAAGGSASSEGMDCDSGDRGASSSQEAGSSEGETSSDSASCNAAAARAAESGSGGSDDGITGGSRGARSSRTLSGGHTTGSDGGFSSSLSSGYETRRSTRRLNTKDLTGALKSTVGQGTGGTGSSGGGGGGGGSGGSGGGTASGSRGRARAECCKRNRS